MISVQPGMIKLTRANTIDDVGPDGLDLGKILDGSHCEEYQSHEFASCVRCMRRGMGGMDEKSWRFGEGEEGKTRRIKDVEMQRRRVRKGQKRKSRVDVAAVLNSFSRCDCGTRKERTKVALAFLFYLVLGILHVMYTTA